MSTYGTGLPPHPLRTSVRPLPEQRNWPPPSGRLEIPYNPQLTGVVNTGPQPPGIAGPSPGPAPGSSPPDFAGPSPGPAPGSSPPELPGGGGGSSEEEGQNDQEEPLPRDPNFDPNNIRESLYNPYDDDKPPCSHCAADIHNRVCDQDTPCWECLRRHIVEAEDCRTSRPCEFCFMNEMPCDAGTPCQHCMFLGFGADECRPEGISEQRYFPNPPDPNESDEEPFIHPLGYEEGAEFDYSCAFCVAYGFKRCNPQDRPCLTCVQYGRTEQQCRFEERCGRCLELDLPCDGKMPCSLCATADGLTSMMCLGRGDTTMPGVNDPVPEGNDIGMGEGGDYPGIPGYENAYPPQEQNNVFGLGPGDPLQQEFDPFGPNNPQQQPFDPFGPDDPPQQEFIDPNRLPAGVPGQSILPQNEVPRAPPGGFFQVPAHVRTALLPHYRIRTDVYTNGNFDPIPGGHVSWNDWDPQFRCKVTLASGLPCHNLPTIDCDGDEEHGDEKFGVCTRCRNRAVEYTAYLMGEVEEKKNLFCCATCSQAQMIAFTERGFQDGELLVDNHCDCDAQMRAWLCFGCRSKVIHTVGNRMISTRERLTRDSDNAILCPRCGVEPGNKEAAYTLARGLAKCSSCWSWINYAT
ncbi:hypothetical protein V494_05868 [Pseudogymnoascus sp. VKM F-4513 (FW-928)]|nr:hypothetical protein V494_05868 [Pseudogymnoascus sp. VKM F-4513 (FW-928)]